MVTVFDFDERASKKMERNREQRRMAATNGLTRRRQRSNSLRDSPGSNFLDLSDLNLLNFFFLSLIFNDFFYDLQKKKKR